MSSTNSSNISYQTAWNKALEHLSNLPPAQKKQFDLLGPQEQAIFRAAVNPSEVLEVLQQLEASKRSVKRFIKFNENFAKPFSKLSGTIETVVSISSGIGAPVWAPIKYILQELMEAAGDFERISGFLQDTLEKLIRFDEYEKYFQSSPRKALELVQDALTKFYVDIIDLTLVATKHYRCNIAKYVFRRTVKTFDADFGEIMSNMKRHVEAIDPVANLGGMIESRHHHNDVSTKLNSLKIEADSSAANRLEEQKQAAAKWLFCTNPKTHQEKNQEKHLDNTCNWFFKTPKYCAWLDSKDSSRLCVQGIPGCGKSVLSSVTISRLKNQVLPEDSVMYFFCKENDADRDNPLSILRTFIFKLLHHKTHMTTFVDMVHETSLSSGTPSADSVKDLWILLEKMIARIPTVYCIIDGLDECNNKDDSLVKFLTKLTELSISSATVFKIFATSRVGESRIEGRLNEHWSLFMIEEDNVQDDIGVYVSKRIEDSGALKNYSHRKDIHSSILQGAGGMILWAKLMLDELCDAESWDIDNVLANIPGGLPDVYGLMLKRRISSLGTKLLEKCRKTLHWIVIARRPLLVDEILLALAVAGGVGSHEKYDSVSDRAASLQLLQKACGSLITILGDSSVQLVHTSLRQYLLKGIGTSDSQSEVVSTFSAHADQIHMDLARTCLCYNQFACFQDKVIKETASTTYHFLEYSTCNWTYHVVHSGDSSNVLRDEIEAFFSSKQAWRWLQRCNLFNITPRYVSLMEDELNEWARGESSALQTDKNKIGNFILRLCQQRYEDTRQNEETDIETIYVVSIVAEIYRGEGQYSEALEWYERALAGYKKALGEEHPSTLATVNNMASVYDSQGRYSEALEWYERALAGKKKSLGEEHPSTLDTVNNMAIVYHKQGRYSEALEWYERALAGKKKSLGEEHPSTLDTVNNMAIVYHKQGRYSEALEWCERALDGHKKALGEEHPSTLTTVNNMASVYSNQGRYAEALEWCKRALDGHKKALGEEHPSTLTTVYNMAGVYNKQGRYSEALEWYGRALAGYKKALGEEHPSTLNTVNNMASVYSNQGRYSEALEWYEGALAVYKKALGEEHPLTLNTVNNMASVYGSQGRYSEALEWYERALAGKKKALGEEHPSTLATVNNMASVYDNQGRYSEALEWYERALAGYKKALGEEHPSTLGAVNNMRLTQERLKAQVNKPHSSNPNIIPVGTP